MVRHVHILVLGARWSCWWRPAARSCSRKRLDQRGPGGGGPGIGGGLPLRKLELEQEAGSANRPNSSCSNIAKIHAHSYVERAQWARRQAQRQAMDAIPFSEPAVRAAMRDDGGGRGGISRCSRLACPEGEIYGLLGRTSGTATEDSCRSRGANEGAARPPSSAGA